MVGERFSTGHQVTDGLLSGGYEPDIVTTIYGPSGSGKTNLCMVALIACVTQGKKAVFIDAEGGFSITRLGQILPEFKQYLDHILLLKPMNFEEQKKAFEKLKKIVEGTETNIGLIIIDSISMLYRLEKDKENDIANANRELSYQISLVTEIARKKNIPVLVTSQVYSSFEERDKVNLVGGDILKYGSKCLIEIEKYASGVRAAIIRKHRSEPEGKHALFRIVEKGIEAVDEKKGDKEIKRKEDGREKREEKEIVA